MKNWTNKDNISFYKNMSLQSFHDGTIQGGIDNNCDITAAEGYLRQANSVLEVGAGYGRVLSFILSQGYKGFLCGIERDENLCAFLQTKFNKKATIIHADIRDFKSNHTFDAILWMWAGICEFNKHEQPLAMQNLAAHLHKENGCLIFDTISIESKTIKATKKDSHNHIIQTPFGQDYVYIPSEKEILNYAKTSDLMIKEKKVYTTKTNKNRMLYILEYQQI